METVRLERLLIRLMIVELLTLVCFYLVWIGWGRYEQVPVNRS